MLLPRLNTKDTIFHLGAIYLLYWQIEMCYKYENLTLVSLRNMLEFGALYLIMRLMQCRNDRLGLSLPLNLVSMNYNDHMSRMHQRHDHYRNSNESNCYMKKIPSSFCISFVDNISSWGITVCSCVQGSRKRLKMN